MKIELNSQEKMLLNRAADRYYGETNDKPSLWYIMNMLRTHYEEKLETDLETIIDEKIIKHKEAQAKEGKI